MGGYSPKNGDRGHKEKRKPKRVRGFSELPALLAGVNPQKTTDPVAKHQDNLAGKIAELKQNIRAKKKERDAAFDLGTPEGDAQGVAFDKQYLAMLVVLADLEDRQAKKVRPSQLMDMRTEGFILPASA